MAKDYVHIDQERVMKLMESLFQARLEDPGNTELIAAVRRLGNEIKRLADAIADADLSKGVVA